MGNDYRDMTVRPSLCVCADLQPADRRYILLYIWMAREGGGMVPSKPIMSSAKRLRVT